MVDLSGEKAGKYHEKFQVKGISNGINYNVKPKAANITLEKKTKTMHVQPDVSQSDISNEYKIDKQQISPETVKVTGGEEQLNQIAYLKATYKNATKISKDTKDVADVNAYDKDLNKLNVSINPGQVDLKVSVKPFSKKLRLILRLLEI